MDLTPFEKKKLTDYIPQLSLISFIIFLGFYIFFKLYINDANISSGTQLIYPTKSEQNWTKKEIDEATRKSFVLYNKSGFDNYIDAQKILVEAIENDKTSLETRSLLCMVQKKLWPFTNQDIKNQKALFKVLQSVRNVSPSSAYTRVCEAVI